MAHFLRRAKLEEAVVALLRAEGQSPCSFRYLALEGVDRRVIDHPDYDSHEENMLRWHALGGRKSLFASLPQDTEWWAATISCGDLAALVAGDYAAWSLYSGGTRHLLTVAVAIRDGRRPQSQDPLIAKELSKLQESIPAIRRALDEGQTINPLVLLGTGQAGPFYVIEGTKRATALCWRHCLDNIPCPGLEVLVAITGAKEQHEAKRQNCL